MVEAAWKYFWGPNLYMPMACVAIVLMVILAILILAALTYDGD